MVSLRLGEGNSFAFLAKAAAFSPGQEGNCLEGNVQEIFGEHSLRK